MALIALAADKGAPGVTTAAVTLGAVWPRGVLVAECDTSGGDLVYRLPSHEGTRLDPARGLLSLAAQARHGLRSERIWQHTQRLAGGLDVLVGLTTAEQAAGLPWIWGRLGQALGSLPDVDVLADCGRLGARSPMYDLLGQAAAIVVLTRASLDQVAHMRDRVLALANSFGAGGGPTPAIVVVVISEPRQHKQAVDDVNRIVVNSQLPATVLGGFALDPKGASMLRGQWGGRLDKSLLIRSGREVAASLLAHLSGLSGSPG
ncbi:MAG: hypothetical protein ACRDN9_11345 [Streptosporangiaceae bacterium]